MSRRLRNAKVGGSSPVEAAVIDALNATGRLANEVAGHGVHHGLCSADELIERYCAVPLTIDVPAILIRISKRWRRGMSDDELYEATRAAWRVDGTRAARATVAVAVADGIVRGVYSDVRWTRYEGGTGKDVGRWTFTGRRSEEHADWIGRSVVDYFSAGSQNPIRCVGC